MWKQTGRVDGKNVILRKIPAPSLVFNPLAIDERMRAS
jgi:hypothetical protein